MELATKEKVIIYHENWKRRKKCGHIKTFTATNNLNGVFGEWIGAWSSQGRKLITNYNALKLLDVSSNNHIHRL